MSEAIPAFLTLTIMPLTFSITNGIVFGLLAALLFYITTGQFYADLVSMGKSSATSSGLNESSSLLADKYQPSSMDVGQRNRQNSFEVPKLAFMDFKPLIRTPSLVLPKGDADAVRDAQGKSVSSASGESPSVRTRRSVADALRPPCGTGRGELGTRAASAAERSARERERGERIADERGAAQYPSTQYDTARRRTRSRCA